MTTLTEYAEAAEWFVKELADFRKFADLLRGADKVMVLRLCEFEELAATVLRQLAEGKVLCDGEPTYEHFDKVFGRSRHEGFMDQEYDFAYALWEKSWRHSIAAATREETT